MIDTRARVSALAMLAAASLAACGTTPTTTADGDITVVDPWVKATDAGMTAAFGEIVNDTDATLVLVSAGTDISPMVELHETVADETGSTTMREKDGGFEIEPGEALALEPGGNHIMLMGVTEPVKAGAEVDLTLTFDDGTTVQVTAVAKEFAGAQEEYDGGMDEGMDHGDDESHDQ